VIKTDAFLSAHPFGTSPDAFSPDGAPQIRVHTHHALGHDWERRGSRSTDSNTYEAHASQLPGCQSVFGRAPNIPHALRAEDFAVELTTRATRLSSISERPRAGSEAPSPYLVGESLSLAE